MADTHRKVMIAVDGSSYSQKALDFYMDNLHKEGDCVVILTIPEVPQLPVGGYPYPYSHEFYARWKAELEQRDNESKDILKTCGVKLKTKFHESKTRLIKETGSNPGEVICKNAQEEDIGLIVVGSRGLGVFRRTLLGSVSSYVVHHAHCVVVVVPKEMDK